MRPTRPTLSSVFLSLPLAYTLAALVAMPSAQAADLYWDVNGATAGFSTVVGAWNGTNLFWNTDSAGGAGTLSAVPTSADDLFIRQAGTNTGSITLSGATKNASSITFAANVGPTTTLTGGTINIGGTGAVSGIRQQSTGANIINSALQLNSGNTAFEFSNSSTGLLTIGGAVTGTDTSGNVTQTLSIGSSSSGGITFGGIIADVSGSATKVALTVNNTSTGVTTLSGANTYTGLTTVSAGTLAYGANNVIGSGDVTVSGTGILNLGASRTDTVGTVTLQGSGQITGSGATLTSTGTFEVQSGSVSAILAGSGIALNKTTAGTVTLSAANTYTGLTTVSAGTLAYGAYNALGTGAVTVSGTGILDLGGAYTDTVGTVTLQDSGQINGNLTLTSTGTFEMQSGSVTANLGGAAALNKTTSGTVTLSNGNSYTGLTTVLDGTLRYGAASALGSGAVTVNGATAILDMGFNQSDSVGTVTLQNGGQINGTGTSTLTSSGTLELQSGSVSAKISSSLGLNKTTAGTVTISSVANNIGGTTTVSDGKLLYGASDVLGNGAITVNGTGIFDLGANQNEITFGIVKLQGSGQINGTGTSYLQSYSNFDMQSGSVSAILAGNVNLNKTTAGTVTLSGINTYNGLTTVSDGTLLYGTSNVIGIGGVTVNGATAILDLGANQSDSVGTVTLQNGGQINGSGGSTLISTGTFAMQSGSVSAILSGTNIALNKTTSGTVTLSAANTYTGLTTVADGTLAYGASNVISTGGVTVNGATAILDLGANQSDSVGTVTVQGGGQINGSGTSSLTSTGVFTMHSGSVSAILAGSVNLNKSTAGTVTLSGANTYTGLTTVSAGTLAYGASNVISTGGVTVNGATAILDLGANQSDSVGTVTLAGTGQINGTGTSTLTSTGVFTMQSGSVSAILAGDVALNKTTAGTVTLSGANTYTGLTTVSAGTLAYGASNVIGTGAVTVSNTGILNLGANQSDSVGTVTLTGGGQINGSGTSTLTSTGTFEMQFGSVSAILAGAVPLNKTSGGTVTLSGANTYTGATTISGNSSGVLVINGDNSGATGAITITLGTLQLGNGGTTGKLSTSSAIVNNATLRINRSDAVAQGTDFTGAAITGNGALVHLGAGTTTLSAANTFTGNTTVSGGKVALTNPLALQFSAYNTLGSNGTTIGMDVSDPSALDSGKLTLGGLVGAVDLAGAFTAGFTGSVNNLTLNPVATRTPTYSGVIADGASGMTLTKTGLGTQTLSGDNTYTGDTTVNEGILAITHNNALGTTAGKTVVDGVNGRLTLSNNITVAEPITISGYVNTSGLLSSSGTNIISGPVTITNFGARVGASDGSTLTFTGGVTAATADMIFVLNPGSSTVPSGGTLAFTTTPLALMNSGRLYHDFGGVVALGVAGNTFGRVTIGLGTMRLDVENALPSIAEVVMGLDYRSNGGTLDLNGNSQTIFGLRNDIPGAGVSSLVVTSATAATLTLDSSTPGTVPVEVQPGLINPALTSTTAFAYAGTITGALSIVKEGPNTATFSGANTYTGGTTINGGTLALGSAGALGSSGTIAFGGGTLQHSASNTTDYSDRFSTAASQQYSIDTNSQNVTLATALTSTGGSFTKLGAGTLTLTGANTYNGTTTINGGVLVVTNGAAIADTGAVILADVSGANLTVQNSETIGSLRGGGTTGGNVSIASAQTLTVAETGSQTFAGIISDAGGLTKTAAGTLTLTGANTYTGGTTINGGTLALGSAGALGSSGTIAFGGGTLQYSSSNTTDYSDRFSNAASQQYSIDTNSQSVTLATALTSTGGSFTKLGAGTLTLTGANTYTGGTTINGGTLALGSAGAIGSSGTIAFGGGTLQYSASNTTDYSDRFSNGASQQYSIDTNSENVTLASNLTSSGGSLAKLGAGTLTLSGTNTYSGATTVSAGALQVGSSGLGQTGTGAVTVQTGSTLLGTGLVQGSTFTLDNGGTLRPGDSLVDSSHGTLTFDPVSPSGDTSLQGNIILGISGATITDTTYGGNLLGSAGYNNWVDSISGIGTHDQLVFLGTGGHNVSFLTTTGSLQVVSSSFTPARGQVFNLIDWASLMNPNMNFTGFTFNNGYLTGNDDEGADLDLPDLSGSGLAWDMSRFTTSGNIVVVPEPSRALLLMFGLACLAMRRQTSSHPVPALRPGPTRLRPRKRNFLADFCPTSGFTGRARPAATGPVE